MHSRQRSRPAKERRYNRKVQKAKLQATVCAVMLTCSRLGAAKLPFTVDAMMQLTRIDDPQLSPDGKWVAFTTQTVDLAANAKPSQIYVVAVAGGDPQRLTADGQSNSHPRWSADSKRIFFEGDRHGGSQVWSMNPDGSDEKQVTDLPTEAQDAIVSKDGKYAVFTSDVYPGCSPADAKPGVAYDAACNRSKLDADAQTKMHARVYDRLLYRHWTQYAGNRRKHLLIQTLDASNEIRDLTPGDANVPPFSLGGPDAFAFSPDSSSVTYVSNTDLVPANSTNSDLFTIPVTGGEAKRITTNPAADEGPVYSPDGKYLAYRTQLRPGYESDQWKLAVLDVQAGTMRTLADSLDRWVESYTWSPDSKRIIFTIDDHGTVPALMIPVDGGPVRTIAQGPTSISDIQFTPDDKTMVYLDQSGSKPNELCKAVSGGGAGVPLTRFNDSIFNQYQLTPLERIATTGAAGDNIESFVVKPPGFQETNKYPAIIQIHGGPEGDWGEGWTYRWNAQVFAAAGYVVVMPNPHGSIGYGQAFTDAVNGDWGGEPYQDIMAVTDKIASLPYIDKDRIFATGASYGGYMIDWILGHTDRYRALVSHAGVYDLRSEFGTTEELWFPKWEFQGYPWDNPDMYEKFSPSMFVKQFKTPTLVTGGELDYRVPIGQDQQLFTALQEMNVPSKLVQFPDEGHWITKPQNSVFWYKTVIAWLDQYAKNTTSPSMPTAPGEPK